MQQNLRQTAYKVWIKDLVSSEYVKEEGEWKPNYLKIRDKNVSRVNIIANIITTFKNPDNTYASLTLDDGSETIRVKAFRDDISLLENIKPGETILIIGRPREYQNEIYIIPEIIKTVTNPDWVKIRKLELMKLYGSPIKEERIEQASKQNSQITISKEPEEFPEIKSFVEEEIIEDSPIVSETSRQKILNTIEKSNESGISHEELLFKSDIPKEEAETAIQELLKEGEIYFPRAGFIKIV